MGQVAEWGVKAGLPLIRYLGLHVLSISLQDGGFNLSPALQKITF